MENSLSNQKIAEDYIRVEQTIKKTLKLIKKQPLVDNRKKLKHDIKKLLELVRYTHIFACHEVALNNYIDVRDRENETELYTLTRDACVFTQIFAYMFAYHLKDLVHFLFGNESKQAHFNSAINIMVHELNEFKKVLDDIKKKPDLYSKIREGFAANKRDIFELVDAIFELVDVIFKDLLIYVDSDNPLNKKPMVVIHLYLEDKIDDNFCSVKGILQQ